MKTMKIMKGRKKNIFLVMLGVFAFSVLSVKGQDQQSKSLTDTEKIVGLSRLWEGIRSNYVYYDQLTFDWDSLYAAYIPKVMEIKDTYTYLRELERFAASVKDGHTYVNNQGEPARKDRITPAPFETKFIEGRVWVDHVWSSELVNKGVKKGTEVVSINGQSVIEYGEQQLAPFVSSSTTQWLYYRVFSRFQLTKGKRTENITVGFRNGNKEFSMVIDRNMDWDLQKSNNNQQIKMIDYAVIDKNIGLLKIASFNDGSITNLFDSLHSKILSSDALIIDLRDNGGGNSGYADYILRHLSDKPIKTSTWSSRMYIPAHASWGYPDEWYTTTSGFLSPVKKEIYKNPIVVLVNAGTFSSSEDFCVKFRGMKRGKIVGMPTGGSTGNGVRVILVEGLAWANICSKKDVAPDGTEFVGVGIIPDIEVKETISTYLSDKDLQMERAVEVIKNNTQK